MKHLGIFLAGAMGMAVMASTATGCSSSNGNTSSGTGGSGGSSDHSSSSGTGGTGGTSGTPAPPTIGAQIDRTGRPVINPALDHAFDGNMTTADAARDAYNQASDPTKWASNFKGEIAKNLGIFDALDAVCGNQILAGGTATAGRYDTLAGALADDRLWLNTAGATCTTYLAVEANAVGLGASSDCGGRALAYDVMDVTFSALAVGAFSGVTDGVSANDAPFLTGFPYLAAPH